jgi:ABC-type glycerol-3-phosphate transport system substrate-binding protein
MKKSLFQRVMCFILSVATLFGVVVMTVSAGALKPDTSAATLEEMQSLVGTTSYAEYIREYVNEKPGKHVITLSNSNVVGAQKVSESEECIKSNVGERADYNAAAHPDAVYLSSKDKATWTFDVAEDEVGLYYIKITYYNCDTSESSISIIQRKLYLDDKIPFSEAGALHFQKYWISDNVTVEGPFDTTEADGTYVEYKTQTNGNEDDGYYKIVTTVKAGKKTVTTTKISQDINGNSMAPELKQSSDWHTYYCQDSTGYYHGYFNFYVLNGTHTLTLEAEREPMIVDKIELVPVGDGVSDIPTYSEVLDYYAQNGITSATGGKINVIQAEFPDAVSDSSVYATNDNTSAANYPLSSKAQIYNVIGENSYNTVGQWAAYKFTVDKTGLYNISMRYMQNALQGMYVCRAIKLAGGNQYKYGLEDGTPAVPFIEAYNTQFNYSKEWQSTYLTDGSGEAFSFYFEEGCEYTLYVECSLGSLKELIQRVEISLDKINECYLNILQLTGNDPDEYRDYKFIEIMPEVLYELLLQAKELDSVKTEFEVLCGTNGSHITTLQTIAILLDKMGSDDGDYVAANMSTLKSYLGTLGTWINNSKTSKMVVDSITIAPEGSGKAGLQRAEPNFFRAIGFEIASFFWSFFTKYEQMGMTSIPDKDSRQIDVWLASGRDQSQIWRGLIDAKGGFTDSTGVAVTLKLVTGGTLLPSILSGKGPDVYMGLGSTDVINYAIRDAVLGVSGNDPRPEVQNEVFSSNYYTYNENGKYIVVNDPAEYTGSGTLTHKTLTYDEVIGQGEDKNFADAAMDTVRLLGVTYGIPQTMSFSMMFYRMDVLAELGQNVPESWSQLLALLPVLQTNNMSIGVSYIAAIDFMIYQKGGNMWKYPDDPDYQGAKIDLDSDIALEAFDYCCRLYSDYSFPVSYDAANRFRTGEMPIIIGDYAGIYNQLIVYATEITGLWEFTSLPGSTREDGSFNYDSLAGIGATVMLHGCDDMLGAWQFMQWETSADVQSGYGNKMVALIGPSAKYESANLKALNNLSWTANEKLAIEEQMRHLSSIVNYPGSYIINRYTKFAFLAAVNDGADAVDALTGYIDDINAEIKRKREEFGLPTLDADEEPSDVRGEQ